MAEDGVSGMKDTWTGSDGKNITIEGNTGGGDPLPPGQEPDV